MSEPSKALLYSENENFGGKNKPNCMFSSNKENVMRNVFMRLKNSGFVLVDNNINLHSFDKIIKIAFVRREILY